MKETIKMLQNISDDIESDGYSIVLGPDVKKTDILKEFTPQELAEHLSLEDIVNEYGEDDILSEIDSTAIEKYIKSEYGEKPVPVENIVGPSTPHPLWGDQIGEQLSRIVQEKGELETIQILENL